MQIWPGCPLAFYRINVRPIRRTTIFNGSSHNGLLCAVKAQSLGEGPGLAKMRPGQKWHCLTALFLHTAFSIKWPIVAFPSFFFPSAFSLPLSLSLSLFYFFFPSLLAILLLLVLTRFSLATSIPSHCSRNLVLSPFI